MVHTSIQIYEPSTKLGHCYLFAYSMVCSLIYDGKIRGDDQERHYIQSTGD